MCYAKCMDTTQSETLTDTTNLLPSVSSLMDTLAPILLLSSILSIVLVVAYIFSVIRRYKVEKAILAMQKDIHEMNERQRSQNQAAPSEAKRIPSEDTTLIASETPKEPLE